MRAVDVVAPFCVGGAGAGFVAFVDYGAVEEVPAEREVEVVVWVVGVAQGFEGREGIDCGGDVGGGERCCGD